MRDLVPCAQFKKREKHPWRSVTKSKTPPWIFSPFFYLYRWYQIAQSTTYGLLESGLPQIDERNKSFAVGESKQPTKKSDFKIREVIKDLLN